MNREQAIQRIANLIASEQYSNQVLAYELYPQLNKLHNIGILSYHIVAETIFNGFSKRLNFSIEEQEALLDNLDYINSQTTIFSFDFTLLRYNIKITSKLRTEKKGMGILHEFVYYHLYWNNCLYKTFTLHIYLPNQNLHDRLIQAIHNLIVEIENENKL